MRARSVGFAALIGFSVAFGASGARSADRAAAPGSAAETSPPKADYYTRRAETVIAAEKSAAARTHPLAQSYPGFDIVVCEAGCPESGKPTIVFARAEAARGSSATGGETANASATPAARDGDENAPDCLAGCYSRTASADVVPPPALPSGWPAEMKAAPAAAAASGSRAPSPAVRDKLSPIR